MAEKTSADDEEKRRIQQSYSYRLLEAGFRQLFEQARRERKSINQMLAKPRPPL